MRLLGIDAGEKRIGIALSDRSNKIALPLTVLSNDGSLKSNLLKIIENNNISAIVVGMPLNLKGEKGFAAKTVEKFIEENLHETSIKKNIKIIKMDERFTTKISKKSSWFSKKRSRQKKIDGNLDMMSAVIVLNDYLEREKIDD